MKGSFCKYGDLVLLYCGERPALPPELCMICLELAGLCGGGRRQSFFCVYF